jgi:hypothetical protein
VCIDHALKNTACPAPFAKMKIRLAEPRQQVAIAMRVAFSKPHRCQGTGGELFVPAYARESVQAPCKIEDQSGVVRLEDQCAAKRFESLMEPAHQAKLIPEFAKVLGTIDAYFGRRRRGFTRAIEGE